MQGSPINTLLILPSDILNIIVSMIGSRGFFDLWFCGSRQLNEFLSLSVNQIQLHDNSLDSTSRYPKLLSRLKNLTRLSITSVHNRIEDDEMLGDELRRLSPKITFLHLHCPNAEACFIDQSNFHLDSLFGDSRRDIGLVASEIAPRIWDISKYFPHLQSLHLSAESRSYLQDEDIKLLPRSLTSFSVHGSSMLSNQCIPYLPKGLTHLKLGFRVTLNVNAKHLPPNLQTLRIGYRPHVEALQDLPRSITNFDASFHSISEQQLKALPPLITKLNLISSAFQTSALQHLPQRLTELHIDFCESLCLCAELVRLLPRTLKSFFWTRSSRQQGSIEEVLDFPPNLEKLSLQDDSVVDLHIQSLPGSMRTFELLTPSKVTLAGLRRLPEALVELRLEGWSALNDSDLLATESAHSSLFQALPRKLKHFAAFEVFSISEPSCISDLPRTLTCLDIGKVRGCKDDYFFSDLPDTLIRLSFNSTKVSSACFKLLPTGLQIFHMKFNTHIKISRGDFLDLPRGLKELNLGSCARLDPDSIAELPRCLEILILSECDTLKVDSFAHLPPRLKVLSLKEVIDMEDESIGLLPRSITTLWIAHAPRITERAAAYIPPRVMSCRIGESNLGYRVIMRERCRRRNDPIEVPDSRVVERWSNRRGEEQSKEDCVSV